MAKKEFKIGEVFQCGLVKLKCAENIEGCRECFFDVDEPCFAHVSLVGHCDSLSREDNTDVIFVKVEDIEN